MPNRRKSNTNWRSTTRSVCFYPMQIKQSALRALHYQTVLHRILLTVKGRKRRARPLANKHCERKAVFKQDQRRHQAANGIPLPRVPSFCAACTLSLLSMSIWGIGSGYSLAKRSNANVYGPVSVRQEICLGHSLANAMHMFVVPSVFITCRTNSPGNIIKDSAENRNQSRVLAIYRCTCAGQSTEGSKDQAPGFGIQTLSAAPGRFSSRAEHHLYPACILVSPP